MTYPRLSCIALLSCLIACADDPVPSPEQSDTEIGETEIGETEIGDTDDSDTDVGETDPPETDGEEPATCEHDAVDDCCCFDGADALYVDVTCASEAACEQIDVHCPGESRDCTAAEGTITNPEALDCTLQALADGAIGEVSWSFTGEAIPGFAWRSRTLYLRGDGTAFSLQMSGYDSPEPHQGVDLVELRPDASGCVDLEGDADRLQCLVDAVATVVEGCVPPST